MGSPVRSAPLRGPGEVAEDEARGEVADAYARLRETLGVPFIPTVFRMLARHERYLAACTDALGAVLAGGAGERCAAAQRARGGELARERPPERVDAGSAVADVHALLDRYNVANPRNLMLVQALAGGRVAPADGVMDRAPDAASGRGARTVLADVLECHGGFTVPGMWRELADTDADLAAACWSRVRLLAGTPELMRARADTIAIARGTGARASVPTPEQAGLDADAARDVDRILSWFSVVIAAMVLEIEYVRAAVASSSP